MSKPKSDSRPDHGTHEVKSCPNVSGDIGEHSSTQQDDSWYSKLFGSWSNPKVETTHNTEKPAGSEKDLTRDTNAAPDGSEPDHMRGSTQQDGSWYSKLFGSWSNSKVETTHNTEKPAGSDKVLTRDTTAVQDGNEPDHMRGSTQQDGSWYSTLFGSWSNPKVETTHNTEKPAGSEKDLARDTTAVQDGSEPDHMGGSTQQDGSWYSTLFGSWSNPKVETAHNTEKPAGSDKNLARYTTAVPDDSYWGGHSHRPEPPRDTGRYNVDTCLGSTPTQQDDSKISKIWSGFLEFFRKEAPVSPDPHKEASFSPVPPDPQKEDPAPPGESKPDEDTSAP